MTQPALALPQDGNEDGPRIYPWPPQPPYEFQVMSVTSATKGGLPKPFLVGWAAKMAAEFVVDNMGAVEALINAGEKRAAIDVIKGARFRDSGNKADRGTIVHSALEAYVDGKPLTQEDIEAQLEEKRVDPALAKATLGMAKGVVKFLEDTEPEIVWSEKTVFSRTYGYAGTADLLGLMHIGESRVPVVLDVKTSKRIYDEVSLQLCAYARADFVGLPDGTESPLFPDGQVPEYGVAIRPMARGGYEAVLFALTDDVFELFLSCLKTARLEGSGVLAKARRKW